MSTAGGHVIGGDAGSAHLVRLAFADGTVLEDAAGDGVVLFFAAPGVTFPPGLRSATPPGNLLAEYDEFTDLD
jgi:hypothetical protein